MKAIVTVMVLMCAVSCATDEVSTIQSAVINGDPDDVIGEPIPVTSPEAKPVIDQIDPLNTERLPIQCWVYADANRIGISCCTIRNNRYNLCCSLDTYGARCSYP